MKLMYLSLGIWGVCQMAENSALPMTGNQAMQTDNHLSLKGAKDMGGG